MIYEVLMRQRELVCCSVKRIPCTLPYHNGKQKRATSIGSKTPDKIALDRDGLDF